MSYLLEEDLTSQGIDTKTTLQIKFNNRVYVRVKTLPMQFYERARIIKEEYTARNIDSLLIKHKSWIAVWAEKQHELNKAESKYIHRIHDNNSTFENGNFRLKNTAKKYPLNNEGFFALQEEDSLSSDQQDRGVTYEENLFDNAYTTNTTKESVKSIKKSRNITDDKRVLDNNSKKLAKLGNFPRKYRGYTY